MISLREIRERCEKATEGPWIGILIQDGKIVLQSYKTLKPLTPNNADFIKEARTDLPRLVEWCSQAHAALSETAMSLAELDKLLSELEP